MQVAVAKKDLVQILTGTTRVLEARNTIPILANVLLQAANGTLSVRATNLDMEACAVAAADVKAPGATTVAGARLFDIVRRLPDSATINATLGDGSLTLKSGRSRFVLPTLSPDDFPALSGGDFTHTFSLDLPALLPRVKFAISNEETRYYLRGVFMHQIDNEYRLVATDGHRLAAVKIDVPDGAEGVPSVILPRGAIDVLATLKGDVEISIASTRAQFKCDDFTLITKLIDGSYPDYQRIVPAGNDRILTVDITDLKAAVERVAAIGAEAGRGIKFGMAADSLRIEMKTGNGADASDELPADYSAEPMEIKFNHKYFLEAISAVSAESVEIAMANPGTTAILRAPGSRDFSIIMPMRI